MFNFQTVRLIWILASLMILAFQSDPVWKLLVVFGVYLLVLALGAYRIGYNFYFKSLNKVPDSPNRIALTFDDGPTPYTLEVLQVLEKFDAKATFFCIGKQIEKYPEILMKIQKQGHLIGNHTYNHNLQFTISPLKQVIQEIDQTNEAIRKVLGMDTIFFRPPFGVTNPKIGKALENLRMKSIGWNRRSLDTSLKSQDQILKRTTGNLKSGDIVLFHDHLPTTPDTIRKFLEIATKMGFKSDRIDVLTGSQDYAI